MKMYLKGAITLLILFVFLGWILPPLINAKDDISVFVGLALLISIFPGLSMVWKYEIKKNIDDKKENS